MNFEWKVGCANSISRAPFAAGENSEAFVREEAIKKIGRNVDCTKYKTFLISFTLG